MKIVCDNCATKYQIADEKVSGKAFKIRCKKCGHVIVVNKSPGEAGAAAGDAGGSAGAEAAPAADAAAPAGDAVWHLVIDREQVGPMTVAEVQGKVKAGQADAETYGWREGFDDWLKLSAIEDFKSMFAGGGAAAGVADPSLAGQAPGIDAPVRTAAPGAATIVSDGMNAPDLAAIQAAMASQKAPAAVAPAAVAAPLAPAPASAPEPEPPMSSGGGAMDAPVKSMMGARSENSVLFSLNNLSALAGGSGGGGGGGGGGAASSKQQAQAGYASAQSEASGLIDIRAMAAATLGSPGGGPAGPSQSKGPADFFGGSDAPPVFTPLAPAVLMPSSEPEGTPKWVFGLIAVVVVLAIGMVGVIVYLLQDSGKPTVATNVPGKDPTPSSGGTTTAIGKDTGTSTAESPGTKPSAPADTKTDTKPASGDTKKPSGKDSGSKSDGEKKPRGSKEKDKEKDSGSSKPEVGKAPPEPAAPPPPPKKDAPPKKRDDLDSLLDSASSGSGGKPSKSAEKKDLPEQLSMSTIQGTLKGVNVSSCKSEGASGTVMVKLTIKGDGKVSSASPQGGAPGGDCVAKAVKSARFGEFSGDPMTLTFPFIVR